MIPIDSLKIPLMIFSGGFKKMALTRYRPEPWLAHAMPRVRHCQAEVHATEYEGAALKRLSFSCLDDS